MSLLVHELLIGTGGGGSAAANLQTSPSGPVSIASVAVSHPSSSIQSHFQQNRVVTITSGHSRLNNSNEKGSRLAEALAGNPPYSTYSSNPSYQFPHSSHQQTIPHYFSGARYSSPQVSHLTTSSSHSHLTTSSSHLTTSRSLSRQSSILPFVLQDHNYGAPPPTPTPPHSPPSSTQINATTVSSPLPYSYRVHQIFAPTGITNPNNSRNDCSVTCPTIKAQKQLRKVGSEHSILTLNNVGAVQITSTTNSAIVGSSESSSVASQIMASMPLHQQQFMPHPKATIFSPPNVIGEDLSSPIDVALSIGGLDTDDESRLSDRSSSGGPSGEETETAPEGEGEEHVQADDSITRCICNFTHDDGYMIQCDRCFVWQHVDCMEIDRQNIPDEYLCEACKPRRTDKNKARALQIRRRQEIRAQLSRVSSSDSDDNVSFSKNKIGGTKSQDRKVLKKKKPKSSKENKNNRKPCLTTPRSSTNTSILNVNKPLTPIEDRDLTKQIKSRRRQSSCSIGSQGNSDDSCITLNLDQLRSWIEDYEVAVTNHYSPELRAKVHAARINGISAEFRESTQGALLGHRCRVAPLYNASMESFESKILVATTTLSEGTAIIEYQGKYTLNSQWNSVQIPPTLPYLPFVLQYNMQKEGLVVCVDARTYGNDARFARRSALSNSEIRHVVERGSVHLYIVASKLIEEEEEIILPLDTALCQSLTPPTKITQILSKPFSAPVEPIKEEGVENKKEEIAIVTKTNLQCSPVRKNGLLQSKKCARKPLLTLPLPQPLNRTNRRATSIDNISSDDFCSPTQALSPVKQRRASGCGGSRSPMKSPNKSPAKQPLIEECSNGDSQSPLHDSPTGSTDKMDSHKMTREERKIAAYMKAFERMEKAAQRRQDMVKKKEVGKERRQSGGTNDDEEGNRSESAEEPIKVSHSECEKRKGIKISRGSIHKLSSDSFEDENNESSEGERARIYDGPMTGYSSPPSACSSQGGFRFPKTKKALMNEWLNETIDPVLHSSTTFSGELPSGVPTCYMRSPSMPTRKCSGGSGSNANGAGVSFVEMAGRSAKKRWLRQAIIDETEPQSMTFSMCSSPNSRPDSPIAGGDYITPLKKRRLARESMSSEQSNTPPSTPHHPGLEEKFSEEMEIDHILDETLELKEEKPLLALSNKVKVEANLNEDQLKKECLVKKETDLKLSSDDDDDSKEINSSSDQLTINISQISGSLKTEEDSKDFAKQQPQENLSRIKIEVKEESINDGSLHNNRCRQTSNRKSKSKSPRRKTKVTLINNADPRNTRAISKSKNSKESISKKNNLCSKSKLHKIPNVNNNNNNNYNNSNNNNNINDDIERKERVSKKKNKFEKNKRKVIKPLSPEVNKDTSKSRRFKKRRKAVSKEKLCLKSGAGTEVNIIQERLLNNSSDVIDLSISNKEAQNTNKLNNLDQLLSPEHRTAFCSSPSNVSHNSEKTTPLNSLSVSNCDVDEIKGPKTPDGTPPETPVREDNAAPNATYNKFSQCSHDLEHCLQMEKDFTNNLGENDERLSTHVNFSDFSYPSMHHLHQGNDFGERKLLNRNNLSDPQEENINVDPEQIKEEMSFNSTYSSLMSNKPAPVKRKLSILEYRKRKSISCERDPKEVPCLSEARSKTGRWSIDDDSTVTESNMEFETIPLVNEWKSKKDASLKGLMNLNEFHCSPPPLDDLSCSPQSPISPCTMLTDMIPLGNAGGDNNIHSSKEVKWNAAPTQLEQQRENLTARLRREFGLCLPDDFEARQKRSKVETLFKETLTEGESNLFGGRTSLPASNSSYSMYSKGPSSSLLGQKSLEKPFHILPISTEAVAHSKSKDSDTSFLSSSTSNGSFDLKNSRIPNVLSIVAHSPPTLSNVEKFGGFKNVSSVCDVKCGDNMTEIPIMSVPVASISSAGTSAVAVTDAQYEYNITKTDSRDESKVSTKPLLLPDL